MSNIPPVKGPGGSPQNPEKEKLPSVDKSFEEIYKTREIDPDEKKKRKRNQEAEEEKTAEEETKLSNQKKAITPPEKSFELNTLPSTTKEAPDASFSDFPNKNIESSPLSSEKQSSTPQPSSIGAGNFPNQTEESLKKTETPLTDFENIRATVSLIPEIIPEIVAIPVEEASQESLSQTTSHKEEKEQEELLESDQISYVTPTQIIPFPTPSSPPLPFTIDTFLNYTAGMIGAMSHTISQESQETTIELNAKEFQNSVFYNCKLIIKRSEWSPKEYSIQFLGSPEAKDLLEKYRSQILKSFATKFNSFTIRNFEIFLMDSSDQNPRVI
jgi:hypothetical protein